VETVVTHFESLQDEMTSLLGDALAADISVAVPLINTLNALVNMHGNRLAAIEDHNIVFLLVVPRLSPRC
jgi:hypothetical protein